MMKYRHIIWDWNGTLLNDRWLCLESINILLADRGNPPLSEEIYLDIFDFPVRNYYVKAGFDFSIEDFKMPALQFIDLYDRKRKECSLHEGALEVLKYFADKGISQSLLSASESEVLNDMVDFFGLKNYFTRISGLNNHYASSKLDLGRNLIKSIEARPEEILMIGDTCHDQEVAQELGVDIILFNQGHFPEYRLKDCGCNIISSLSSLIESFFSEHQH